MGIFEEELEGLQSLVAQNVRVEVEPGADADFVHVLHEYPNHSERNVLTLEVGDLYAREPRRIIMVFLLGPEAGRKFHSGQALTENLAPSPATT